MPNYPCFDVKYHKEYASGQLQVLDTERHAQQAVMRHQAAVRLHAEAGKDPSRNRTALKKWMQMRDDLFDSQYAMSRGAADLSVFAEYLSTHPTFSKTSKACETFKDYMNYAAILGQIQGWLPRDYSWKRDDTDAGVSMQQAQENLRLLSKQDCKATSSSKGSRAPAAYQLSEQEFKNIAAAGRRMEDPPKSLATLVLLAMLKQSLQRGKTIASLQWQQLSIAEAKANNWGKPVRLANAQAAQMKNSAQTKGNDHKDYIGRQLSITEPCLFFLLALSLVITEDYLTKPPFRTTQQGSFFDSIIKGDMHPAGKRPHPLFPDYMQPVDAYPAFQDFLWISKTSKDGSELMPLTEDDRKRYLKKAFVDAGVTDKNALSYAARYAGFGLALGQQGERVLSSCAVH